MKATLALIACPLTALAASAKLVSGPFVALAGKTPINASGREFYTNKPASTYCPAGVSGLDCSQFVGTQTILVNGDTGYAGLSVTVPGGQQGKKPHPQLYNLSRDTQTYAHLYKT
jgi:hypothetical protein